MHEAARQFRNACKRLFGLLNVQNCTLKVFFHFVCLDSPEALRYLSLFSGSNRPLLESWGIKLVGAHCQYQYGSLTHFYLFFLRFCGKQAASSRPAYPVSRTFPGSSSARRQLTAARPHLNSIATYNVCAASCFILQRW